MADAVAKGFFTLQPDVDAVKKGVTGLGEQLKGTFGKLGGALGDLLGGNIQSALQKVTSSVGGGGVLSPLTAGVIGAAGAAGVALFQLGSEFDRTYKSIQKQTGATGDQLDGLKDTFKNVAKSTGASFENIGNTVATLSQRTGASGKDLETLSLAMLRMSSVTGKDLNTVIETSTKAFQNWGIPVAEMPGALDKLYVASANSGIGVDQLGGALQAFGPTLRQLGFGFDESVAMLASFDKAGLNSQKITGAMSIALGNLAKSGEKDVPGAFKKTVEAIQSAKDPSEAMGIAIELFGKKAGPQLAEAIQQGAFSVGDLEAALGGAEGALAKTASETATFSGKMAKFKNSMKVAFEPIAMGLFDAITSALMFVTPLLSKFASFIGTVVAAVLNCKPAMIALGVAIAAYGALLLLANAATIAQTVATTALTLAKTIETTVVTGAKVAWAALNLVMSLNPIGLVIIAVVALVAAIVLLWQKCDWFREAIGAVWDALVTGATAVKDAFVAAFEWVRNAISTVFEWVKEHWPLLLAILTGPIGLAVAAIVKYWDEIKAVIEKVVGWFTEMPGRIIAGLGNLGEKLVKWVTDAWDWALEAVKTAATKIVDWVKEHWVQLLIAAILVPLTGPAGIAIAILSGFEPVKKFITETLPGFFKELPGKIIDSFGGVKDFITNTLPGWFKDIPKKIGSAFAGLGNLILPDLSALEDLPGIVKNALSGALDTIKALPGQIVGALSGMASQVTSIVSGALSSVTNVLGGLGGSIAGALKGLPGQITGALSGLGGVLQQMGSQMIGALSNGMRDASQWVVDVVKAIPGAVQGAIGNAASWLFDAGKNVVQGLINGFRNMWETLKSIVRGIGGIVAGAIGAAGGWLFNAGRDVINGLINGFKNMWETLKSIVRGIGGIVKGAIGAAGDWLYSAGRAVIQGLINGVKALIGQITGAVKGAQGAAKAAMVGAFDWLYSSGKAIIQGLINGITSMVGAVKNAINSVINAAKKLLPFSEPKDKSSPLAGRGSTFYSGISIASSLAEGIAQATPLVLAATADMARAAVVNAQAHDFSAIGAGMVDLEAGSSGGAAGYTLNMYVAEADTSQMQAGFRRLELLSGAA